MVKHTQEEILEIMARFGVSYAEAEAAPYGVLTVIADNWTLTARHREIARQVAARIDAGEPPLAVIPRQTADVPDA